jgi:SAM-dependent methyltransferase
MARTENMTAQLDFGYPWWLSYGHLILAVPAALLLFIALKRRWPTGLIVVLGLISAWSLAAFAATRFIVNANGRGSLPTENFLTSGTGRVLDMGAGTGRSSIMVLEARPQTTLVALDLFGDSYVHHFGPAGTPEGRLLANLRAAGVDQRATVQAGDMRKLPFQPAEFDAIVSAYAIDHLNRDGIRQSIAEAARVLKPRGEFLLMLIGKDPWLRFTFGPLLMHGSTRGADWWSGRLQEAGFQVMEHGMRPATLYLLARKA